MKNVTFVSHYNKEEMNIRLTDEKYEQLMNNKGYEPMELYLLDADRVAYGKEPQIFSASQIKRLNKALIGTEYWGKIEG